MPEIWLEIKPYAVNIVSFGFPALALLISILSFLDSRKANKVQERLHQLEEKLIIFELEEKEKERDEADKTSVEVRIYNVSKDNYRMKFWNSGKGTAYNVDFVTPEQLKGIVWRDKVPYEFLEPGKSFEEHVMVYAGVPRKFIVIITWSDSIGNTFSKEQIVTI
jgi:hypothetical protein